MKDNLDLQSNGSNNGYQQVLKECLVPMTIRIGCIQSNKGAAEANRNFTHEKIIRHIAGNVEQLKEEPVATHIYSKKSPIVRVVSSSTSNFSMQGHVRFENLLISSEFEHSNSESSEQDGSILFSKEITEENSATNFIFNQISSQSDVLLVDASTIEESRAPECENMPSDIELLISENIALEYSPCLIIIRENDLFDFVSANSSQMQAGLNVKELSLKLDSELREILLFESLLTERNRKIEDVTDTEAGNGRDNKKAHNGNHTIIEERNEAVQRITDYNGESSLETQELRPDFEYQGPIGSSNSLISWHKVFRKFVGFLSPKSSKQNNGLTHQKHVSRDFENEKLESKVPENDNLQSQQSSQTCHILFAQFLRADHLAIRYANAHRSSFILIYCLGAFALINAAIAIGFAKVGWLALTSALLEFFALVGIFKLYKNDHNKKYHIKWLEYRSLAEMLRMAPLLNSVGITQSARGFERHRKQHEPELASRHNVGRIWLIIFTESLMRWVNFDRVKISHKNLRSAKIFLREKILKSQISYHQNNAHKMHIVGHNLGHFSFILFVLAFVFVSGKLLTKFLASMHWGIDEVMLSQAGHGLGVLAAVCPMIGSAAFAIRNHAEFDISSQRSLAMLKNLKGDIDALDNMPEPIQYDKLVELTVKTSLTMQSETADWLEIYEVKETEPG